MKKLIIILFIAICLVIPNQKLEAKSTKLIKGNFYQGKIIWRSLELNLNSGLGLGTFLGKTLLERQNAKLLFKDDKNLGGASVVISWSPKNILL